MHLLRLFLTGKKNQAGYKGYELSIRIDTGVTELQKNSCTLMMIMRIHANDETLLIFSEGWSVFVFT